MKELVKKWLCRACDTVCLHDEMLTFPNPFDPENDTIYGCPHCKQVNALERACDAYGCDQPVSTGTSNVNGIRYVLACGKHTPHDGKFPGPDPNCVKDKDP